MTKGMKTSEFSVTALAVLAEVTGQLKDVPEHILKYGSVVLAAYILSRGIAKRGAQ